MLTFRDIVSVLGHFLIETLKLFYDLNWVLIMYVFRTEIKKNTVFAICNAKAQNFVAVHICSHISCENQCFRVTALYHISVHM